MFLVSVKAEVISVKKHKNFVALNERRNPFTTEKNRMNEQIERTVFAVSLTESVKRSARFLFVGSFSVLKLHFLEKNNDKISEERL